MEVVVAVAVAVFLRPASPLAKAFLMAPAGERTDPPAVEVEVDGPEAGLTGLVVGLRNDDEGAEAGTGELVLPFPPDPPALVDALLAVVLRSLALAI